MVKVITDMWRYEPAQGKGENSHQIVVDSVVVDALLLLLWLWFYEIEYVCRSLLSWSSFHSKMSKIPRRDHFKIKASQIFIGFVFVSLLTYNPDVFGRDFAVSRRQSSSPRFRICHQLRRLASWEKEGQGCASHRLMVGDVQAMTAPVTPSVMASLLVLRNQFLVRCGSDSTRDVILPTYDLTNSVLETQGRRFCERCWWVCDSLWLEKDD